jgi:MoxR-like ATPase
VPGLGKTTLLRTLARTLQLKYSRIQFTPDLMPADIVGSMIMESDERGGKTLRFQYGPTSRTWCWPTKSTVPLPKRNPRC